MDKKQGDSIWFDRYWSAFRRSVHILIAKGYEGAIDKIKARKNRDETDITGFIAEAIEDWLLSGPDWCDGFYIQEEPLVPGKTSAGMQRTGRRRQKPDIVIGYAMKPRPKYFFEAKRLRQKENSGDYTTSTGMGCFINGEYASDYMEAGMVGYIEVETVEYWCTFLKDEIHTKGPDLELVALKENVQVVSELPIGWTSEHERVAVGKPIVIFHILLDCR